MVRRAGSVIGIGFALVALVFFLLRAERATPEVAPLQAPTSEVGPSSKDAPELEVPELPTPDARRVTVPVVSSPQPPRSEKGRMLSGRVVDDLGTPISEFTIEVRTPGAARQEQGRSRSFSSPDGAFGIEALGPGQWQLAASTADGHRSAPLVVDATKADGELLLVLQRSSTVTGFVVDADGAPVDQAAVDVVAAGEEDDIGWRPGDQEPASSTDPSGRFVVEDVAPGALRLRARHPGFSDSEWEEITVAPGEWRTDIRITLTTGGRITGRLDPSLSPLADRQISLFSFRRTKGWRETRTDALGEFVIEGVVPQDYIIELRPAEYGQPGFKGTPGIRKRVSAQKGETTEVVFGDVTAQVSVRGRITAGGKPRAGLAVRAIPMDGEDNGEKSTTDQDGRYELTHCGPGLTRFFIQSGDHSIGFERLVPNEAYVDLDFEVHAGRIAGRVVDAGGKPVGVLPVTVILEEATPDARSESYARVRTNSEGFFEFDLLGPGTYTLRVPDGEWLNRPPPDYKKGRVLHTGLELPENGSLLGLEIRLAPEGRLSGQALDASGAPVAGAWICLRDASGRTMSVSWETRSDATGHFEISSIAPGTYTVSARDDQAKGESDSCTVAAGRTATIQVVLR